MNIRLAKHSDVKKIANLLEQAFSKRDAESAKKEIKEMFSRSVIRPTYVVAVEDHKIVGVAGFIQSWFDYQVYEIFWVAVKPEVQGMGIGKRMINDVVVRIRELKRNSKAQAIVLTTETPAFFMKCGFEKISKLPGIRYLMIRNLK